jgi:uncharacterized membrane protein YfcA
MDAVWIGMMIGLIMALTGSGGALIAIPLFMRFLEMNLIEATNLSLVAVSLSAFFNLVAQWERVDYRLSLSIIPFSIATSYFMSPLKTLVSEWMIFLLLVFVSCLGIVSVWWPIKKHANTKKKTKFYYLGSALLGVVLGALTTFTGLGGGVILMPAYILIFRFSQEEAVATSFLPILLTSLFAFWFQWKIGFVPPKPSAFLSLAGGIATMAILFPYLLKRFSFDSIHSMRRISFSLIVILSLTNILGALACK